MELTFQKGAMLSKIHNMTEDLNRVYREEFTEKVTFGQRYKKGKSSNPCCYLGAEISGRGQMYKGPEAGICLVCQKKNTEASMDEAV